MINEGVLISVIQEERLRWNKHIDYVNFKISKSISVLHEVKHF